MDFKIEEDLFYQEKDLKNEDLWPAIGERLSRIDPPVSVEGQKPGTRRLRKPLKAIRLAYVSLALLMIAGIVLILYFGAKSFYATRVWDQGRKIAMREKPVQSGAGFPQATIDSAFIRGKRAKVFVFVRPRESNVSLFWLEPEGDRQEGGANERKGLE